MSTLRSLAALPAAGALLLLLTVIGGLLSRSTRAFSSRSRLLILALPVAVSLGAGIAALATPAASPAPAALALATSTIPASLAALALSQILGPRFGTLARAVVVALKAIAPPVLAAVLGSVEHSVVPPAVIASVTTAVAAALGTYQWAAGPRPAMQAAAMFIDENEKMRRAWRPDVTTPMLANAASPPPAAPARPLSSFDPQRRAHARTDSYLSERSVATLPEWSFSFGCTTTTPAGPGGNRESMVLGLDIPADVAEVTEESESITRLARMVEEEENSNVSGTTAGFDGDAHADANMHHQRSLSTDSYWNTTTNPYDQSIPVSALRHTPAAPTHRRTGSTPYANDFTLIASYSPHPAAPLPRGFDSLTTLRGSRDMTSVQDDRRASRISTGPSAGPREREVSAMTGMTATSASDGPILPAAPTPGKRTRSPLRAHPRGMGSISERIAVPLPPPTARRHSRVPSLAPTLPPIHGTSTGLPAAPKMPPPIENLTATLARAPANSSRHFWLAAPATAVLTWALSLPALVTLSPGTGALVAFAIAQLLPAPVLAAAVFWPQGARRNISRGASPADSDATYAAELGREKEKGLEMDTDVDVEAGPALAYASSPSGAPQIGGGFGAAFDPLVQRRSGAPVAREYAFHAYRMSLFGVQAAAGSSQSAGVAEGGDEAIKETATVPAPAAAPVSEAVSDKGKLALNDVPEAMIPKSNVEVTLEDFKTPKPADSVTPTPKAIPVPTPVAAPAVGPDRRSLVSRIRYMLGLAAPAPVAQLDPDESLNRDFRGSPSVRSTPGARPMSGGTPAKEASSAKAEVKMVRKTTSTASSLFLTAIGNASTSASTSASPCADSSLSASINTNMSSSCDGLEASVQTATRARRSPHQSFYLADRARIADAARLDAMTAGILANFGFLVPAEVEMVQDEPHTPGKRSTRSGRSKASASGSHRSRGTPSTMLTSDDDTTEQLRTPFKFRVRECPSDSLHLPFRPSMDADTHSSTPQRRHGQQRACVSRHVRELSAQSHWSQYSAELGTELPACGFGLAAPESPASSFSASPASARSRSRSHSHSRWASAGSQGQGPDFSRPSRAPTIDYSAPRGRVETMGDATAADGSMVQNAALARQFLGAHGSHGLQRSPGKAPSPHSYRSRLSPYARANDPVTPPHRGGLSPGDQLITRGNATPSTLSGRSAHSSLTSLETGVAEMERVLALDTPARARWVATPASSVRSIKSVRSLKSLRSVKSNPTLRTQARAGSGRSRANSDTRRREDVPPPPPPLPLPSALPPLPPLPLPLPLPPRQEMALRTPTQHPHPPPLHALERSRTFSRAQGLFGSSESLEAALRESPQPGPNHHNSSRTLAPPRGSLDGLAFEDVAAPMMTPTHTHRAARTLQHDSGLRGTAELLSLSPASEQSESDIAMVTGALAGAGARQVLGERVNLPEPTIASASDLPKKAKRTSKGASKETKGSKGSSSKGSKGSRGSHNSKKSRTGSKASTSFKGSRGSVRPSMPPPPHPRSSAGSAGVCINKENNSYSWHSRSHSYAVSANMSFPYPTPWDRMRPELPTNTTGVPANLANVRTGRGRAAARTSVHVGSVGLRM